MFELQGPLSVVVETDPFWHNRLLLELDSNADDELENSKSFAVEEIMLALCRMRFGNSCALPLPCHHRPRPSSHRKRENRLAEPPVIMILVPLMSPWCLVVH